MTILVVLLFSFSSAPNPLDPRTSILAFSLFLSFSFLFFPFTTVQWSNMKSVRDQLSVFEDAWIFYMFFNLENLVFEDFSFVSEEKPIDQRHDMQPEHPILTAIRQQHRKRSFSSGNFRKRDRTDLICVVCHAPAIGKMTPSRWPTSSSAFFFCLGYNFDQITCESCKAFFRRNALNNVVRRIVCWSSSPHPFTPRRSSSVASEPMIASLV